MFVCEKQLVILQQFRTSFFVQFALDVTRIRLTAQQNGPQNPDTTTSCGPTKVGPSFVALTSPIIFKTISVIDIATLFIRKNIQILYFFPVSMIGAQRRRA